MWFFFFVSDRHDCLASYAKHLKAGAYADSSKKTMRTHLQAYLLFCEFYSFQPFPVSDANYELYIAFLSKSIKSYNTLVGYLNTIKQFSAYLGYNTSFADSYQVRLLLRASRKVLGDHPFRKDPITVQILTDIFHKLDLSNPLHAVMYALFLVAFFSLLRKSNLVPSTYKDLLCSTPYFLQRRDLVFSSSGMFLQVYRTKTIQFQERTLSIPLPRIPNSILCPVSALQHYFSLVPVASYHPLFIQVHSPRSWRPILAHQFSSFLKDTLSSIGINSSNFSPHSFRRGGATFAFQAGAHPLFIKCLGDWKSDAYLVYLHLSPQHKAQAVNILSNRLTNIS